MKVRVLRKQKCGGGDSCGPLKAEAGARCLDGGAVQQWQPSEAPSTPFDQLTGA